LITYLAPVLPFTAHKAATFLGRDVDDWQALDRPMLDVPVNTFQPLITRIDPLKIQAVVDASRESLKQTGANPGMRVI
jgi:methionyl-tRNA synthetase